MSCDNSQLTTPLPLVAPMHLEALCIAPQETSENAKFARPMANFRLLAQEGSEKANLSEIVLNEPFDERDSRLLPGVHLHWALPDALTHGQMKYQISRRAINELRLLGVPKPILVKILQTLRPDWVTLLADNADQKNLSVPLQQFWEDGMTLLHGDDFFDQTVALQSELFGGPKTDALKAKLSEDAASEFFDDETALMAWLAGVLGQAEAERHRPHFVHTAGISWFPPVPNRWLLVRLVTARDGALGTDPNTPHWQAWVVESDFLANKVEECVPDSMGETDEVRARRNMVTTVPSPTTRDGRLLDPKDPQPYKFMGRVTPLTDWQETAPGATSAAGTGRFPNLSAVGYGEPTFASYYPNCRTVFGFYDSLSDTGGVDWANSQLSYLAVGWYSDDAQDPLHARPEGEALAAYLAERKWKLPDGSDHQALGRLLCSGSLFGLTWGEADYLGNNGSSAQLVIGNTAAEALATYLGRNTPAQTPSVTQVIEALQLGLLDTYLHDDGGLGALENGLHSSQFGAASGGHIWVLGKTGQEADEKAGSSLTPAQRFEQATQPHDDGAQTFGQVTLPEPLAKQLDDLNVLQQQFERLMDTAADRRWQLFSDWYRYMVLLSATQELDGQARGVLLDRLNDVTDQPTPDTQELAKRWQVLVKAKGDLEQAIAGKYLLKTVPAPRYYHPTDLVVMLVGDDVTPSHRYGADGRDEPDGRLLCRRLDQVLCAGAWAEGVAGAAQALLQHTPPPLAEALPRLLAELVMIAYADPGMAGLRQGKAAAGEQFAGYSGCAPAPIGLTNWQASGGGNPWHPLLLQWHATFKPLHAIKGAGPDYDAGQFLQKTVQLEPDHIDLTYRDLPAVDDRDEADYQETSATVVLTPHATRTLAGEVNRFLAGDDEEIPDSVKTWLTQAEQSRTSILSQALAGFNDALLMRKQTLQFTLYNPMEAGSMTTKVANQVGMEHDVAPEFTWYFNPIRAGLLRFDKFRLVDAFGQVREVPVTNENLLVARSLRRPGGEVDANRFDIVLPLRITQPARLWLRWLSARDDGIEMNAHPATSPIFGWVLVNHLESSLMVYGGDGEMLGTLRVPQDAGQVQWYPAPGTDIAWDQLDAAPPEPGPGTDNRRQHLQAFVTGLKGYRENDFDAFLQQINRVLTLIEPGSHRQHDAMAVLMSRPLALTRANIRLELKGIPAENQSLAMVDRKAPAALANGFDKLPFPVRLGDLSMLSDGLVGFFMETGVAAGQVYAYDNFRTEDAGDSTFTLTCQADDTRTMTLLVDPRAKVHATAGILPVKSIEIPPDQYAGALKRMAFTFLVNPLLSPGTLSVDSSTGVPSLPELQLPLPAESARPWTWVGRTRSQDGRTRPWYAATTLRVADGSAHLGVQPPTAWEGWLKLSEFDEEDGK